MHVEGPTCWGRAPKGCMPRGLTLGHHCWGATCLHPHIGMGGLPRGGCWGPGRASPSAEGVPGAKGHVLLPSLEGRERVSGSWL